MNDKTPTHPVTTTGIVVLFAFLAAILTFRSASLYGPGLSPDSVGYLRLAKDIAQNGFAFLSQNSSVSQPPGYPLALAALAAPTGIAPLTAASWLNAFCAAALVALVLFAVLRMTNSRLALLFCGPLLCFSKPLSTVWSMAWSEPLFILFVLLALVFAACERQPWTSALCSGLFAAAACLTRYAGIVLIPVIAVFFLLSAPPSGILKRFGRAALYAALPAATFGLCVIRNYALSGSPLGTRAPSQTGLMENAGGAFGIVLSWLLPWKPRSAAAAGLLLIVSCAVAAALWRRRMQVAESLRRADKAPLLCAAFSALYCGFIVSSASSVAFDHIDDRLLSPVFPLLVILGAALLKPGAWRREHARLAVLGLICVFFAISPFRKTWSKIGKKAEQGAGGYNTRQWRDSALIRHFRDSGQPKGEHVFSNTPDALYILADIEADLSPAARYYNSDRPTGITRENLFSKYPDLDGALWVWFNDNPNGHFYTPKELAGICRLTAVKESPDGAIYRIGRPDTPPTPDK